jgi:site-specific DNA-methyltransferase (adenine-specific)
VIPKPYFENDGVTLYHGDCRKILPELPRESFDLVLTDPPYVVGYSGRWGSDWGVIEGDTDQSWVLPVYREIWRTLKPDSLCCTFYGWPSADVFFDAWSLTGFRPVSVLVLIKGRWGLGYFTRAQHEQAYILAKGRPQKPEKAISDVLIWDDIANQLHPNQKPLGAISKLVATYSGRERTILDPFCGSGTTLIAARNLGRCAVGIEIDERHCELAARRLSQQVFQFPACSGAPEQLQFIY